MRLLAKIFLSVITVFSLVFLLSGYFLLSYSFESSVGREIDFALRQYKYDRFSVQAGLIANEEVFLNEIPAKRNVKGIYKKMTVDVIAPVYYMAVDETVLYNEMGESDQFDIAKLTEDSYLYQVLHQGNKSFILYGSQIWQDDLCLNFVTKTDITEAITQQRILQQYYERCFYIAMGAAILLILGLSIFLTNPLKRMTRAADQIADGCYHERLQMKGKDELGELAESFNRMAAAVEKSIVDLSEEAQRKEDFVANFAHELKTPLTSVIGYADRIYQKNMLRAEVKKSASYIWNEGMRLEALSLKLMDLTNLNRQEFLCAWMPARELLQDVTEGMNEVLAERGVVIRCKAEEAYIKVDYDLMKTLLINLIDNAAKAECKIIQIDGKQDGHIYRIEVLDDGKGIPEQELSRITEAFYMVDKARSRKQHGAGIGLALVKRIVEIQDGELTIQSKVNAGTKVTVCLPLEEGGGENG